MEESRAVASATELQPLLLSVWHPALEVRRRARQQTDDNDHHRCGVRWDPECDPFVMPIFPYAPRQALGDSPLYLFKIKGLSNNKRH
ncbi:hypothetical protein EYF80_024559 [Liparis tanakae]|uniref:Uncharacterized protein n=1 Tax=Liparis tanakae TaxID=230148 RepID=A0A4Z2HIB2_9TELE|nr:hypothetical protein EYF80_024559 [Liparis tanakae]